MMNEDSYNLAEIWQFTGNGAGGRGGFSGEIGLGQFSDFNAGGGSDDDLIVSRKRKGMEREGLKGVASTSSDNGNVLNDNIVGDGMRIDGNRTGKDFRDGRTGAIEKPRSGVNGDQSAPEATKPPKQDYIHVRARRGQATDSHSLAERARREKISERMKILQDLVPGCNKVIGKALVLDEIINYIQSLQRQVEFLSMKLEAINSRIIPGIELFSVKDFGQQAYDQSGMAYGPQAGREYSRGASPEWLHMQVGSSGFERT